jgi:NAD(P)-dependent dehydrogenase (short-subunit alcohol dehydrogenase family)
MRLKLLLLNWSQTHAVRSLLCVDDNTEEHQVNSDMTPEDFNVIGVGCDVSSELSVQRAFEQVMDTYGRLDSVVASAGESLRLPHQSSGTRNNMM